MSKLPADLVTAIRTVAEQRWDCIDVLDSDTQNLVNVTNFYLPDDEQIKDPYSDPPDTDPRALPPRESYSG